MEILVLTKCLTFSKEDAILLKLSIRLFPIFAASFPSFTSDNTMVVLLFISLIILLAASIAAFNASKFVCSDIFIILDNMLFILFILFSNSCTLLAAEVTVPY